MKRLLFSPQIQLISVVLLIFLIHIAHIVWIRQEAFSAYDVSYWKDRFEHSQWQLPISQRGIGDDGLFAYVGYKMALGQDPSLVNAETAPVGKYLLGFSTLFFHSPAFISFFLGVGCLLLFFLLAKSLVKNTFLSLLATVVLSFDPLFFSQLTGSWIDISQLFFLLLFFFCFFSSFSSKKYAFILLGLSGMSLGLFSEVKLPVLSPFIFLITVIVLVMQREWKKILWFVLMVVVGFLIPYGYYFLFHSPKAFLQLQKYILAFYIKSHHTVHHDSLVRILLFGQFPNISSGALGKVDEFWVFWPFVAISGWIGSIFLVLKGKLIEEKVLSWYILLASVVFLFIPIYPRYLLLFIPILFLIAIRILVIKFPKLTIISLVCFLFFSVVTSIIYLSSSPQNIVTSLSYNLSHSFFQDIYEENMYQPQKLELDREQFRKLSQQTFVDAEIMQIKIKENNHKFTKDEETIAITETYLTRRLGTFSENKTLKLKLVHGTWKIIWDWNLVFNNFLPGDAVKATINSGKRGSIVDASGTLLAHDADGYLVSVTLSQIDATKEQAMLAFFTSLSGMQAVGLQNAYQENAIPGEAVPLFTLTTAGDTSQIRQKIIEYRGVTVTGYPSRVYNAIPAASIGNTVFHECCSRIYTSSTYHGIFGIEKQYDAQLQGFDGGKVELFDKKGELKRVLMQRQSHDGRDIQVTL